MFQLFTDRARRAVVLAQEEARSLQHDHIGTEHLLLGLVAEGGGVAARALRDLGADTASMRARLRSEAGPGGEEPENHIPFTPQAKQALELSLRESVRLGHDYIGTEHLLLGLLEEGEGAAFQVLTAADIEPDAARVKVVELLSQLSAGEE